MAASLLLRQGRSGAMKTMLLDARVFRGLAPSVSLSAESGKSEKGLPPNPKKQSPPKNVVEPKERGQLVATPTAAELSKNLSSPRAHPSVVSPGGLVAGPGPGPEGSMLFTAEGAPDFRSRKTVVETPQKVPSPLRKQGTDAKALRESRGDDSSSSSSSSSSSDSDSEGEGESSTADPQGTSRGRGGPPRPQASCPLGDGAPRIAVVAKEKPRSPPDVPPPERPRPVKKKGGTIKPPEDRKDTKRKTTTPKSQADKEFMKQNVKEKQFQKILRSSETDKEGQKLPKVEEVLPAHTESGLSTQPAGSPAPIQWRERTGTARPPPAAPEASERHRGQHAAERGGEVAFPLFSKENLGAQVTEGTLKASGETLEGQASVRSLKPVPAPSEGSDFQDKAAGPEPEGGAGMAEDPAPPGGPDGTQESAHAASASEPLDSATYKNLQHHDYTPYTFLDLNLDLSKFRMPQPSSGRESPRH
ncbi:NADH dehydrogenase [ubiquinone] flavoprotein 3, mitochondrial isoform X1 [Acinonyx jubatus]|uniref:NADH dehydrogenase [ubiquinone] flavoprotein 3, mitochondrial isoform X1 n=1 Tax=Acinonyx jubatus TaxID=32536 RepID=A0A6J0A6N3_ACIJB|nr:NADH dehydrogenase [ubiquinone] flavoprotein 3, mitochondrial isoform X1 [Acinonyx jubatus]